MSIKARQKLVPTSKYDIKCPSTMVAEYITVHNTANDASANSEVSYMISNNSETSFHFAIDDKEVVQGLPLNRHAWHTGDSDKGEGNLKSIGIEICYSKSGGDKYKKAEALTIKFIAQLLKERKWDIDRVRTHKSWTEIGVKRGLSKYVKNCPHRILDEGRWSSFLNAIKVELMKLNDMDKPKVVVPKKEATKSPSKAVKKVSASVSKVTPKKLTKKKFVILPANSTSWAVYPLGQPVKKELAKHFINPSLYNGLTYLIIASPQKDVYTIKSDKFGKVNIYAAPSTGAKIIEK